MKAKLVFWQDSFAALRTLHMLHALWLFRHPDPSREKSFPSYCTEALGILLPFPHIYRKSGDLA
jgi:hypothetical protein